MATERIYSPRIRIHEVLERNRACTIDLPVYRDNALVSPTAAYLRLTDPEYITFVRWVYAVLGTYYR